MASNDVRIVIVADSGQAQQEMGKLEGAAKKVGGAFGDMAKIAGGMAINQGIGQAVQGFKGAIAGASSLNESLSKSNTIFKDNAKAIENWASTASTGFGQSKAQALDAAGSFGNMFVQLGIGTDVAADMSMAMTELASDFASFHNADITEVINAQSAAFRGEYDSLQRFVPTINAAAVEMEALAMTGKTLTGELTQQEKALAVQSLMMKGAGEAMGDFDRTSEGAANQQRILKAQLSDVQAEIGNVFLPAVVAIGKVFVNEVVPAIKAFVDEAGPKLKEFMASVKIWWEQDAKPAIENLQTAFETIWPIIEPILKQFIATVELWGTVFANTVGIIIDLISGDFSGAWEKAKNILRAFEEFFDATMGNLAEFVFNLGPILRDLAVAAMNALWDGIKSVAGSVQSYFQDEFLGDLKYAASQVISFMLDVGEQIVRGIWNGIKGMTGWLVDNIKGFADDVLGAIKSGFGVSSPSRMTMVIGYEIVEGLALGIDKNTGRVIAAVDNIVDNISRTWDQGMEMAGRSMVEVMTGWMDALADSIDMGKDLSEEVLVAMLNQLSWITHNAGLPEDMREMAENAIDEMVNSFREGKGVSTQAVIDLLGEMMSLAIPAATAAGAAVGAAFASGVAANAGGGMIGGLPAGVSLPGAGGITGTAPSNTSGSGFQTGMTVAHGPDGPMYYANGEWHVMTQADLQKYLYKSNTVQQPGGGTVSSPGISPIGYTGNGAVENAQWVPGKGWVIQMVVDGQVLTEIVLGHLNRQMA